jgi:hypothetical protein
MPAVKDVGRSIVPSSRKRVPKELLIQPRREEPEIG